MSYLNLNWTADGHPLLESPDQSHAYAIVALEDGTFTVTHGTWNEETQSVDEHILYEGLPDPDRALQHVLDHEGHVYQDDDRVVVMGFKDGQLREFPGFRTSR
jgi:hypothetical protein